MPVILDPAPPEVLEVLKKVMRERFPDLLVHDVRIEVLMATNPDGGPAVKKHGSPAAAAISIVKDVERCKLKPKAPDERIKVDAARYAEMGPVRREALFAHELLHVVLPRDENNKVKLDAYNRPATRHRHDDWLISGFRRVYEWYGEESLEYASYETLGEILGQASFPFMAEPVPARASDLDEEDIEPDDDEEPDEEESDDSDDDESDDTADDPDPDTADVHRMPTARGRGKSAG